MKNKLHKSSFLLGVLTTLLAVSLVVPALAVATKTIEVTTGVKIYIDDQELHPTDPNGNPVEPFIYDGTTYLPVRAVSEAVGKVVQWEGSTWSVYLGKHDGGVPAIYLNNLDYFTNYHNWEWGKLQKDNLGREHTNTIRCTDSRDGSITYKLNGQYRRLTGTFFQRYDYRGATDNGATLVIYGDGRELWQGNVAPGRDPVDINVNLTGVLELKLEFPSGSGISPYHTCLGEVGLWS